MKLGDLITFEIAGHTFKGVIIEERGKLGVGGRNIVRIKPVDADPFHEFELPEEDCLLVERGWIKTEDAHSTSYTRELPQWFVDEMERQDKEGR